MDVVTPPAFAQMLDWAATMYAHIYIATDTYFAHSPGCDLAS